MKRCYQGQHWYLVINCTTRCAQHTLPQKRQGETFTTTHDPRDIFCDPKNLKRLCTATSVKDVSVWRKQCLIAFQQCVTFSLDISLGRCFKAKILRCHVFLFFQFLLCLFQIYWDVWGVRTTRQISYVAVFPDHTNILTIQIWHPHINTYITQTKSKEIILGILGNPGSNWQTGKWVKVRLQTFLCLVSRAFNNPIT